MATMIATAMPPASRPYSIAVAPDRSVSLLRSIPHSRAWRRHATSVSGAAERRASQSSESGRGTASNSGGVSEDWIVVSFRRPRYLADVPGRKLCVPPSPVVCPFEEWRKMARDGTRHLPPKMGAEHNKSARSRQ